MLSPLGKPVVSQPAGCPCRRSSLALQEAQSHCSFESFELEPSLHWLLASPSSLVQPPLLRVQVLGSSGDPQRLPESLPGVSTVGTRRERKPRHPCCNELTPTEDRGREPMCKLVQLYGGQVNSSCEISMHTSFDQEFHFYPAGLGTDRKGHMCKAVHCRAVCKSRGLAQI